MQNQYIDRVLQHLRRQCMNGRHGGMLYVLMLMADPGREARLQGQEEAVWVAR